MCLKPFVLSTWVKFASQDQLLGLAISRGFLKPEVILKITSKGLLRSKTYMNPPYLLPHLIGDIIEQ